MRKSLQGLGLTDARLDKSKKEGDARLGWGLILVECHLLCLCFDGDIDGSLELVPGVIIPLQILKPSVMFPENLQK